jgi:hypothetical protein
MGFRLCFRNRRRIYKRVGRLYAELPLSLPRGNLDGSERRLPRTFILPHRYFLW